MIPYLLWSEIFVFFGILFQRQKITKYTIKTVCLGRRGIVVEFMVYIDIYNCLYWNIYHKFNFSKLIKSKYKQLENLFTKFLFNFTLTCYILKNLVYIRYK